MLSNCSKCFLLFQFSYKCFTCLSSSTRFSIFTIKSQLTILVSNFFSIFCIYSKLSCSTSISSQSTRPCISSNLTSSSSTFIYFYISIMECSKVFQNSLLNFMGLNFFIFFIIIIYYFSILSILTIFTISSFLTLTTISPTNIYSENI